MARAWTLTDECRNSRATRELISGQEFAGSLVSTLSWVSWLLSCCAVNGTVLLAQVMSEIHGTVRDQDGLPIVGAKVLIRCEGSGTVTKSNTGSDGEFGVVDLPPRLYTITAGHDGFTNQVYEHLDLAMNRQIRLDITLAVGSIEQSITVGTAPPLLETTSTSTRYTILPGQVQSMPLNGRNYLMTTSAFTRGFTWPFATSRNKCIPKCSLNFSR